jgi:hypothetical protein
MPRRFGGGPKLRLLGGKEIEPTSHPVSSNYRFQVDYCRHAKLQLSVQPTIDLAQKEMPASRGCRHGDSASTTDMVRAQRGNSCNNITSRSGSWPNGCAQDRYGFAAYIDCWHRRLAIRDGSRAGRSDLVLHAKPQCRTLVLGPLFAATSLKFGLRIAAFIAALASIARRCGLRQLVAEVLHENAPMLTLFRNCGFARAVGPDRS